MASPSQPGPRSQAAEDHLWDYLAVVLRHRKFALAIFLTATAVATIRTLLTRPVYHGDGADPHRAREVERPQLQGRHGSRRRQDDYYQTQYRLLQSRSLARRVVETLNLLQDPEFGGPRAPQEVQAALAAPPGSSPVMEGAIDGLLGRLRINAGKGTRLVGVGCEAFRPDLAMNIANKVSQLYIEQTLEFRYQTSSEAGQWLGGQIDQQRKKVEQAPRS